MASAAIFMTPQAERDLLDEHLWHQLGGPDENGDTHETQFERFQRETEQFWAALIGPDEYARRRIIAAIDESTSNWSRVTVGADGTVIIEHADAQAKHLVPPPGPSDHAMPANRCVPARE